MLDISRNEIWLVNFDPTIGDEIQKTRPAVVVSVRTPYRHKLRIVVPITSWQEKFTDQFWMVKLASTLSNGLDQDSTANAFQVKSISEQRFIRKLGVLSDDQMDDITMAIALCIDAPT
jgi:mRNA interferase MazF